MILRLAANAAVSTAGGVVFGVTAALAACTVAQVVQRGMRRQRKSGLDDIASAPPQGGPSASPPGAPPVPPSDPKAPDPTGL